MAHHTLTIWYEDGTKRDISLEPGVYSAGSDLSCDLYFHPEDAVPRFEIDHTPGTGELKVTARQKGVTLAGTDLAVDTTVLWPSASRLSAGSIAMTFSDVLPAPPKASLPLGSITRPNMLFGISMALGLGYFALGLFETADTTQQQAALAVPQHVMSIQQASTEVRRLTDSWPSHLKPSVMVGAKKMTIRLHEQASGNMTLLTQIESFRIQHDESITVLDVPYSDEQFTALGIDALTVRPRKLVLTRFGNAVGIGETLGASWQLRDITQTNIVVSRSNLTKAIRLKAI